MNLTRRTDVTKHVCLDVAGFLAQSDRELRRCLRSITRGDGSRFPDVRALRAAFLEELAQGHKVIPMGKPCEGFSYETGCPGHTEEASRG
jgi:hypothetical protein